MYFLYEALKKFLIFVILALLTFVNIIVPISGSATATPLLALITDPHNAIGLASFYFVLSGLVRIFVFRKHIRYGYIKNLLPISLIGAVIGALSLIEINPTILFIIIFLFLIYFIYKKIREIISNGMKAKKMHKTEDEILKQQGFGIVYETG